MTTDRTVTRRQAAALLVAAMLTAACTISDDGNDDPTPSTDPTTVTGTDPTTDPTTVVTTAPTTATPALGEITFQPAAAQAPTHPVDGCTMQAGVVVGRGLDAVPPGLSLVSSAQQLTVRLNETGQQVIDFTEEEFNLLRTGGFDLYTTDVPNADPLAFGMDSPRLSPVYVYGVGGHIIFLPGSQPRPESAGPTALSYAPTASGTIGVVDTGLDPALDAGSPGFKPELADPSLVDHVKVVDSDLDADTGTSGVAGHGTFIATLVRQLPDGPEVVMTAARLGTHAVTDGTTGGVLVEGTTAGWSVYTAVVRLADQLVKTGAPLSLSLGTESCSGDDELLLDAALDYWRDTVGGEVFAAAGNGSAKAAGPLPAMGPADRPGVVGVGAVGWTGTRALFSNAGDVDGPGVCLVADRGPTLGGVTAWSGTSFATPLVAAASLTAPVASFDAMAAYKGLGQQDGDRVDPATRAACESQVAP